MLASSLLSNGEIFVWATGFCITFINNNIILFIFNIFIIVVYLLLSHLRALLF